LSAIDHVSTEGRRTVVEDNGDGAGHPDWDD
jgi:hypothetical protein